jgi:hypothetical protein
MKKSFYRFFVFIVSEIAKDIQSILLLVKNLDDGFESKIATPLQQHRTLGSQLVKKK